MRGKANTAIARFWRAETGSLIVFTLFILLAMLMCVGVGIDAMRHEMYRTRLQNTADRAALAAANLEEDRDAVTVARDYWTRAGLPDAASSVSAQGANNFRQVDLTASIKINTMLLKLVGTETVDVNILSTAREERNEVEISLVLDYSMSMISNQKYQRLQAAATEFVSSIYARDEDGLTTMNFVPYAGTVNAGPQLFDLLGGVREWDNDTHSCLELDTTDFRNTGFPTGTRQVPHFERYYNANDPNSAFGWCPSNENRVLIAQSNETALNDVIMKSKMSGGTGTDIAMKWGLALLDPGIRNALEDLSPSLPMSERPRTGRPRDWDEPNTDKIIVLMTDGGITGQLRPIKTGDYFDETPDDPSNACASIDDVNDVDCVNWNARNAAWKIGPQMNNKHGETNQYTMVKGSDALKNFYESCDLAKANGVTIYTIAYNANNNAQTQMRNCASTPAYFYNVDVLDISEAFSSIALAISDIRLTQ